MRRPRGRLAVAAGLLCAAAVAGAPAVRAHDARATQDTRPIEDEFLKGMFTPAFKPPAPGTYELPAIKRVGEYLLRDAEGRLVSTGAVMAGKAAVVSFIYTGCSDRFGCPLASMALREIQTRLRAEGLARRAVLVSISFDPGRDSPVLLARYARAYDADPALWRFLTAPSDAVLARVLDGYGQDRAPVHDERGRFTGRYRHVLKVFLVDPRGDVRNVYSAGFLVPEVVINDIKTVLDAGSGGRTAAH